MPQPTDNQLAAAAQKARADHETAREIAARLLAPPDPVDILAGVIADRGDVADERDELRAKCDALTADLEAIRFMVGRPELSLVEAVRRRGDDARESQNTLRSALEAANRCIGQIAVALGLSEHAPAVAVIGRAKAAHENRAAADLRAALDRVAMEAGVDTEGDGFDVADRVIAVLRAMQARPVLTVERLADALRAARAKAAHENRAAADLRAALDRVATAAGAGDGGDAADVADRVIAVLRAMQARPMLTVERLADALRAASVTLEPTMAARAVMAAMSHMGDLVLSESPPTSRPAALPADLRTYLETRRDRLQGGHGLGLAAEIAALNRWLALPTAEVTP